jgi:hypothetical protein
MSTDDFEEKFDSKLPKKYTKSFPKDGLNALTQLCRRTIVYSYVQSRSIDADAKWIFPEHVASNTRTNKAYVLIVLDRLEKAGLLSPSEPFPIDREISIGHDYRGFNSMHVFKNGAWYIKKDKRKVSGFKRYDHLEFKTKIIYVKSDWNGKARRINIASESFYQTCIELDINPNIIQN